MQGVAFSQATVTSEAASSSTVFLLFCRSWLLGPSWKMPIPTPINSLKGTLVHSLTQQPRTRRPAKVSTPGQLGQAPFKDPQRSSSHSSWPLLLVCTDDSGAPVTKIELVPACSTVVLIEEPAEGNDPWDLPELRDTGIKWSGKWMSSIQQRPARRTQPVHSVCLYVTWTRVLKNNN